MHLLLHKTEQLFNFRLFRCKLFLHTNFFPVSFYFYPNKFLFGSLKSIDQIHDLSKILLSCLILLKTVHLLLDQSSSCCCFEGPKFHFQFSSYLNFHLVSLLQIFHHRLILNKRSLLYDSRLT